MGIQMFVYQNRTLINKAIAKHFGVQKVRLPKIKPLVSANIKEDKSFLVFAFYDIKNNYIGINMETWDIATEYEHYRTIVHEIIHVYQRAYNLCEFSDVSTNYEERIQEEHCDVHTDMVLSELGLEPVYSALSLI